MKNFESALKIYLQLSNINTDTDLQFKIGLCYKNLKSYDNAIDYLQMSYQNNETNILTFLQLCDTYRLGGQPESATKLFLSSEKKFPLISQILKLKSLLKKTDIN
jgi:tetratricopeptide (TPR) repeat protein